MRSDDFDDGAIARGQLTMPGGRRLCYAVHGRPDGIPVHFMHGLPGSRWQAALVAGQARDLGLCLVAADRPGFGRSDWTPAPRVDDLVADTAALADHLGHARFATLGVSCGGPYALSAARLLPRRVAAVGLLAGMGPMDLPALRRAQMPALKLMFGLGRLHPWLASPMLMLDRLMLLRDPRRALNAIAGLLGEADRQLLKTDAAVARAFAHSLAEAYRPGVRGAVAEIGRIVRHRARDLAGIDTPVYLHQGDQDRHVPVEMARYMAQSLPNASLHLASGEGHLSIVTHSFARCAMQLATHLS